MTGLCHSVGEWSHVKGVEELTGEIKAVVICQSAHTSKKEDGWLYSVERESFTLLMSMGLKQQEIYHLMHCQSSSTPPLHALTTPTCSHVGQQHC